MLAGSPRRARFGIIAQWSVQSSRGCSPSHPRPHPRNRSSNASTRAGNVTYQDPPCTEGEAGRSVELPKAETREDTTAWEEAARSGARACAACPSAGCCARRARPTRSGRATAREDATRSVALRGQGRHGDHRGIRGAQRRVGARRHEPGLPAARPATQRAAPAAAAAAPQAVGAGCAEPQVRACPAATASTCSRRSARPTARKRCRHRAGRRCASAGRPAKRYFYEPAARATRRCARCSAASTARSPTSSAPWCSLRSVRARAVPERELRPSAASDALLLSRAWGPYFAASACACISLTVAL